jgi:hypothetical protein
MTIARRLRDAIAEIRDATRSRAGAVGTGMDSKPGTAAGVSVGGLAAVVNFAMAREQYASRVLFPRRNEATT